jgi:hypothetical protein
MDVYSKESLEDLLKCSVCKNKFSAYDDPKFLPCGSTICSQCDLKIDKNFLDEKKRNFICPIPTCEKEHTKQIDGFTKSHLVVKLMSLQPIEVYRGEKIEKLKTNLDQIQKLVNEIDVSIEYSDLEINKYCNELRREIHLETQEKIKQLSDFNFFLIKEVDNYEKESKESFRLLKNTASKDKINEIKQLAIDNRKYITDYNKQDEDSITNLITKSLEQIDQLEKEKETLKQLLLDNKIIKFNPNKLEKNFLGKICIESSSYTNQSSIIFDLKKENLNQATDYQLASSQESKTSVCIADTPSASNPLSVNNNNLNTNMIFTAANNFLCNVQHAHNFSNNLNFTSNPNRRAIHSSNLSINNSSISPHNNTYRPAFRAANALHPFNSNSNQPNSWSNINPLKNASIINANIRKTPVFF